MDFIPLRGQFLAGFEVHLLANDDCLRARLDRVIHHRQPLAVLAGWLPWRAIETTLSRRFPYSEQRAKYEAMDVLFDVEAVKLGGGVSRDCRSRLPIRLKAGSRYLKHSINLSDDQVVQRWGGNVYFQYFCVQAHVEPGCSATRRRLAASAGPAGK